MSLFPAHIRPPAFWAGLLGGLLVLGLAWTIPVNLKSVTPALLREAGAETPSVAEAGRQWLDAEKPGPAGLALAAARSLSDPQAAALEKALAEAALRQPELVA